MLALLRLNLLQQREQRLEPGSGASRLGEYYSPSSSAVAA